MMPSLHTGYSVVAATMIPILLLCAWVFQPRLAERATEDGFLASSGGAVPPGHRSTTEC